MKEETIPFSFFFFFSLFLFLFLLLLLFFLKKICNKMMWQELGYNHDVLIPSYYIGMRLF
jgi:hypothetical protein